MLKSYNIFLSELFIPIIKNEEVQMINECVPGTGYNHFLFSDKPLIFEQTLYDRVQDYHLGEIEFFRERNNYDTDEIFNGLYYTTVGRGVMSLDNKNKIIKLAEKLINMFPDIEVYKKVLEKAKQIKSKWIK